MVHHSCQSYMANNIIHVSITVQSAGIVHATVERLGFALRG